jgi:leucyl/phenylalanyl-tRNA--protein transferase
MMKPVFCIAEGAFAPDFPPSDQALQDPDGLLAAGGDLSPERLLAAYRRGIFPWYSQDQPILWWTPDPRTVLTPGALKVSRSLQKTRRKGHLRVSVDTAFAATMRKCAEPRFDQAGSWLNREMIAAYCALHQAGHAHSVECWQAGELVGGLYGLSIGRVFFGESMFSRVPDASKVALVHLTERLWAAGYQLLDCQVQSPHLDRLGALPMRRAQFEEALARWCPVPPEGACWVNEEL